MEKQEVVGAQLISIDPMAYVAEIYRPFSARLDAAKEAAKGVTFDVTKPDGMAVAVLHRNAFRDIRIEAEKARVARKAPILEIGRLLDSRSKEIEAQIAPHEARFAGPIKAENDKEKIAAQARIDAEIERIRAEERAKREAEEAKMAADRADIARQQAELAAAQKAARDKIEADERAARLRIEEQERASRKEREEAEAKSRAERIAEENRLRAIEDERRKERDRLAAIAKAESDRLEVIAKAERDAKELADRKKKLIEMDKSDGYTILAAFAKRFEYLPEFTQVIDVITEFLESRKNDNK